MAGTLTAALVVKSIVNAVISVAASYVISSVLSKGPKQRAVDTGPLAANLEAGGPKRVVVGRVGVRAVRLVANERKRDILPYNTRNDTVAMRNRIYHHWVAIISDHPVSAFRNLYINGKKVVIDDLNWVASDPWIDNDDYTINVRYFDGHNNDLSELIELGLLDVGSVGEGTALVWVRHWVPQSDYWIKLFGGAVPDYTFEVDGAAVPDPTDPDCDLSDAGTWKFHRESILVQAFHQICPLGRNRPVGEVDWDQVAAMLPRHAQQITSAHGEVAPRFAADGFWVTRGETHEAVEERIGGTYAGRTVDMAVDEGAGGALQRFHGSDPAAQPFDTISGADGDYGPDGISREDASLLDVRPNGFRYTFPNKEWAWEQYTINWTDPVALASDGGVRRYVDVSSDMVTGHRQAFFLGHLAYLEKRHGHSISAELSLRFLRAQAGDYLALDEPDLGFDGTERLKIQQVSDSSRDYPELILSVDEPAWHGDPGAIEPVPIALSDSTADDIITIDGPAVTVTSGGTALINISGIIMPGARFVITEESPGTLYRVFVEAEYDNGGSSVGLSGAASFDESGVAVVSLGPVPAGVSLGWTVRSQSGSALVTDVSGVHVVSGDIEPPPPPVSLSLASDGEGRVMATITAPTANDLFSIVAGFVSGGAAAPDVSILANRLSAAALSGQVGTTLPFTGISPGTYDFYAIATDRAGNASTAIGPVSITLEAPAP